MKPVKLPESQSLSSLDFGGLATELGATGDSDILSAVGPDAATAKLREEAMRIAKDNPEEAARVIKTWLKE